MTYNPNQPYKNIDGVNINLSADEVTSLQTEQTAYAAQIAITSTNANALTALIASDRTMLRIQEAISLGLATDLTPDVVAWVNYRRALRLLVTATKAQALPIKPPYPQGT